MDKLILVPLVLLLLQPNATEALECACNVCGQETSCTTSPDPESQCFMNVEKVLVNGTYELEYTFGCFSSKEGFLTHLQCHTNSIKQDTVHQIACCRNENFCNKNFPDPDPELDPRWNLDPPPQTEIDRPPEQTHSSDIKLILIAIFSICVILSLFLLAVTCCPRRSIKRSTKESRGSTCSLKTDIDKFQHHIHTTGSSSASTHSYSISEDLNQKISAHNTSTHEESYMTQDLTSGIGEKLLNQRTMARAVGFGKTDYVGNGRFGRVFRGEYHGDDVAIKAFRTIDSDSWSREDMIFRYLNHENIVRFIASEYTSYNNTSEIWMFLEYCPYGSLCDYLDTNEILGQQQAIKILYSIINGLNYLHEDYARASKLYKPSIAHRDIKSKNILMKTPELCCIADFGHALVKLDEDRLDYGKYQYLQVGTIRYMAPEILKPIETLNYRHFSTFAQADLYQFGLILWEVCHRTALDILHPAGNHKLPYDDVVLQNPDIQDMIKIVCDDQCRPPRYEKWERYPYMKRLANLMVECWRPNPKARMETLGVKKKLKELHDEIAPLQRQSNPPNITVTLPNCVN